MQVRENFDHKMLVTFFNVSMIESILKWPAACTED